MKKILSILLLVSMLTMAFTACNSSTDIENENTNQNLEEDSTDAPITEGEDNGNSVSFTVTKEEWATALNLLLNDNYVHTIDFHNEHTTAKTVIEKNGNNIKMTSQPIGQDPMQTQYAIVENGQYRLHEKQDPNAASTYWFYPMEYHNIFLYEDFEYDEKTNAYISDKVIYDAMLGMEMTFSNLSFQFENGKIVKLSYTQWINVSELEIVYTETVTYGTASEIILPALD